MDKKEYVAKNGPHAMLVCPTTTTAAPAGFSGEVIAPNHLAATIVDGEVSGYSPALASYLGAILLAINQGKHAGQFGPMEWEFQPYEG